MLVQTLKLSLKETHLSFPSSLSLSLSRSPESPSPGTSTHGGRCEEDDDEDDYILALFFTVSCSRLHALESLVCLHIVQF
jgi:hypothetical protein